MSIYGPPVQTLKLDWCSHEMAVYAMQNWHYSRCMPTAKTVKIGVWEDGRFVGAVVFSRGATKTLGKPYGLGQTESCELTRVALGKHITPVSRIVALALRMLKKQSPGMRLVISFADPERLHHGGIYQAGNWIYTGMTRPAEEYIVDGKRMHGRSMRAKYGSHLGKDFIQVVWGSSKHRYVMPLDDEMRAHVMSFARPYPSRVTGGNL